MCDSSSAWGLMCLCARSFCGDREHICGCVDLCIKKKREKRKEKFLLT